VKLKLLVASAAVLFLAADKADEETKKELARLKGTWVFESVESERAKLPVEGFKDNRLTIDGDNFSYKEGENVTHGTFKIDATKKPKTLDVTFKDGDLKGKTFTGIYKLEGNTYTVCLDPSGKTRPTEFASKKGSPVVLEVLKREKKNGK